MKADTAAITNPLTNTDQAFLNDPYPVLTRLREEAPVWWCDKESYWVVSRYEDVSMILRDQSYERQIQRWKKAPSSLLVNFIPHLKSLTNVSKSWLMNLNPPAHTRIRSFLNKAFTPSMVHSLKPTIESFADQLLENIDENQFELVSEFAFPLPVTVIALMLGIPVTERDELKGWSQRVTAAAGRRNLKTLMDAGQAIEELAKYLKPIIEKKRLNPEQDLLSILVQEELDGKRLTSEELIANTILILVAGHETTSGLIANTLVSLLRNRQQWDLLNEKPELMSTVIDESLRFESPVQAAPRLAGKDGLLRGQKIKAGDMVWLLLGSANRDASQFENSDAFDITRSKNNHVAFSEGIHRCVGASLAHVESSIAIRKLMERFDKLTLAKTVVNFRSPFAMRAPQELWLTNR